MSVSTLNSISSPTQTIDTNSIYQAVKQDFKNLDSVLQSGSPSGAQQSFAQLLKDKQSLSQTQGATQLHGHHHRHHHTSGNQQAANVSQTSQSSGSQGTADNILTSAVTGVSLSQGSSTTAS